MGIQLTDTIAAEDLGKRWKGECSSLMAGDHIAFRGLLIPFPINFYPISHIQLVESLAPAASSLRSAHPCIRSRSESDWNNPPLLRLSGCFFSHSLSLKQLPSHSIAHVSATPAPALASSATASP
ncbi:unnamed protein product [Linum trigynum]|uniref:Uncharacterized protein n=1 Tax=Linum trigynum TaxID=586398 RepID=A0AAV2DS99_9ROSI